MKTKEYQDKTLLWLSRYYQRCRALQEAGDRFPAATAFMSITGEIHEGAGLPYSPVKQVPGIPYVCLRLPTGGGKTLVACEAVGLGVRELLQLDRALVLWLVPSDAIRAQTLARLKDRDDPYRRALEANLGLVEVLDIDGARTMQRPLLDSHTVVVVTTIQAFRRKDRNALSTYGNSGALMSHFENLPPELEATLLWEKAADNEEKFYHRSLVNVCRLRRPLVIMDEAHNARQPLSFETLRRLNPSAVLELTATPNLKPSVAKEDGEIFENPPSNVLYSVSAYALKAEDMIKLPLYLRYREPWDALLGDALGLLNHLDKEARLEFTVSGEHIRPIMLLQAQPKYKNKSSVTVDVVAAKLKEFGVADDEICIHTGERRGLDDLSVSVMSKESKVRFIITVQALKEGWDCPWAYVLFSAAELGGEKAVEQILGRVLRMPNAKRKVREDLNCAYAFVASAKFSEAAKILKDGLVASGFEEQDAADLVVERDLLVAADVAAPLTVTDKSLTVSLPENPNKPLPLTVADAVTWNQPAGTLTLEKILTREQETDLVTWAESAGASAGETMRQAVNQLAGRITSAPLSAHCPADRGEMFQVPVLAVQQNGVFHQFEKNDISDHDDWDEWSLALCDADLPGFTVPNLDHGIVIDIGQSEESQRAIITQNFLKETDRQLALLQSTAAWPVEKLVCEIDRSFRHERLTQAEIDIWLTRVLAKLLDDGYPLEKLTAYRHRLGRAVAARVGELEKQQHKKIHEDFLFVTGSGAIHTVFSNDCGFAFQPNKYPVNERYHGLALPRHFFKEIGAMNGEEIDCARVIAHDERVVTWVRNLELEPKTSFWIQTSTDKFYPDFVAKLKKNKVLVVEYKGTDRDTTDDTKEKERLGNLWAERSGGDCFFEMVKGPDELGKIQAAIQKALA